MAQGALGAVGIRRVGYGLEVGRSLRTVGGAGAYCVATRTACFIMSPGKKDICSFRAMTRAPGFPRHVEFHAVPQNLRFAVEFITSQNMQKRSF